MNIRFTQEAFEFLKDNKINEIYIYRERFTGCQGPYKMPSVSLLKPKEAISYREFIKDNISIFISFDINEDKNGIEIYLGEYLYKKKLYLKGILKE